MIKALINEFAENTYIISEKKKAIIIDPGANIDEIKEYVNNEGLEVQYILLTHGHFDHIFNLNECIEEFNCDCYIHEKERDFLFDPNLNLSSITYKRITVGNKQRVKTFTEESVFELPYQKITVTHNPGHTRGSSSFFYKHYLFSGDTLFKNGVGRTDLPTGNSTDLDKSIKKILGKFKDNCVVYPGHGAYTTILTLKNLHNYNDKQSY